MDIDGVDVTGIVILDTATGSTTTLKPRIGDPRNYTPTTGWFRPSDGLLAVVCRTTGEIIPDAPPIIPDLVLHDPTSGEERTRNRLKLPGAGYDYDPSHTHQLLPSRDDGIYPRSDGEITRIPGIAGARLAVW